MTLNELRTVHLYKLGSYASQKIMRFGQVLDGDNP